MSLTQKQIESIQVDFGIIYKNYDELDAEKLAPVRGGGEFKASATIRDIEYDGRKGKSTDLQVIEEINATLKIVILDTSIDKLALALPFCTLEGDGSTTPYTLTCKSTDLGIINTSSYLKNITMFAKTTKGDFRKITLYSAMAENGLGLSAKPKGEGEVELEFNAHWDSMDDTKDLFKIETIASIA
jgi:hypothetical protein